jgi:hypothetical protein
MKFHMKGVDTVGGGREDLGFDISMKKARGPWATDSSGSLLALVLQYFQNALLNIKVGTLYYFEVKRSKVKDQT